MTYIQGTVAAVPEANREAFLAHSEAAAKLFVRHGALSVRENWGVDVPDGEVTSFPKSVKCEPGEVVVFSWIEWPDKATCDAAWEVMVPEMEEIGAMPFDGKRMIYGSFETVVSA